MLALVIESVLLAPRALWTTPVRDVPSSLCAVRCSSCQALDLRISGMEDVQRFRGRHAGNPRVDSRRAPADRGENIDRLPRTALVPRAFSAGLFNDHVTVSTGRFAVADVNLRARNRRAAGGRVAFAPASHTGLGSILFLLRPLAGIYRGGARTLLRDRNYLPAVLMFWPLALWICGDTQTAVTAMPGRTSLRTLRPPSVPLPPVLASLTYLAADLWGNVRDQALVWAARNPESPRAQVTASQIERAHGENAAAIAQLQYALQHRLRTSARAELIGAKCEAGNLTDRTSSAQPRHCVRLRLQAARRRLVDPQSFRGQRRGLPGPDSRRT